MYFDIFERHRNECRRQWFVQDKPDDNWIIGYARSRVALPDGGTCYVGQFSGTLDETISLDKFLEFCKSSGTENVEAVANQTESFPSAGLPTPALDLNPFRVRFRCAPRRMQTGPPPRFLSVYLAWSTAC
jgi:hypothetical protein